MLPGRPSGTVSPEVDMSLAWSRRLTGTPRRPRGGSGQATQGPVGPQPALWSPRCLCWSLKPFVAAGLLTGKSEQENRNFCAEFTLLETEGFLLRPQLLVGRRGYTSLSSVTALLVLFFNC